jgi:hypothetical protein
VRHHIADRLADPLGDRLVFAGADARKLLAEPPSRREQEVPRAGGQVADAEGEECVFSKRTSE